MIKNVLIIGKLKCKYVKKKHKFIDGFINMFFDKVITNKDFIDFKDKLQSELENI